MYEHVTPRESLRYLRDIEDESSHFYANDGSKLTNLFDLYYFLKNCDDSVFRYHINESKNDLADWVGAVILDSKLSFALRNCIIREPMQYRVLRRINHLVSYPSFNLSSLSANEQAKIILEPAKTPEEVMVTADGKKLKDLWDLSDFLQIADQSTLEYHTSNGKNDLADWVDEVLLDEKLANLFRKNKSRDQMILFTALRLNELGKQLGSEDQLNSYYARIKKSLGSSL